MMTTANVVFSGPASKVDPLTRSTTIASGVTVTPGMLVELDGNGEFILHATAGTGNDVLIADMNVVEQKAVTEDLTAGDTAKAFVPEVGCTYNVILTDGETITKGDPLSSSGDGKVVAATTGGATPDVTLFIAEESLSPSGADGRIRARYVNSANVAAS